MTHRTGQKGGANARSHPRRDRGSPVLRRRSTRPMSDPFETTRVPITVTPPIIQYIPYPIQSTYSRVRAQINSASRSLFATREALSA